MLILLLLLVVVVVVVPPKTLNTHDILKPCGCSVARAAG